MRKSLCLRMILGWIKQADQIQVDEILDAAVERRKVLFPDWDMMYIALPKNDREACIRYLTKTIDMIKKS